MAARTFRGPILTLHPEVRSIFARGTGAGAANLTALTSAGGGVASVAHRGSTGKYRITMADKFNTLLFLNGTVIDPTAVDDWIVVVEADMSSKVIDIAVFKGGALTDLTSDEKLLLEIIVTDSARAS